MKKLTILLLTLLLPLVAKADDSGCDVDGNGKVTITDAVKVVNKILEQE